MKDRIQSILHEKGLTAWKFAEIINVQPSNISHILSGRNKPSFDFIEKILLSFEDINPEWLLLGRGDMYRTNKEITNVNNTGLVIENQVIESNNTSITNVNIPDLNVEQSHTSSNLNEQEEVFTSVKQEESPLPILDDSKADSIQIKEELPKEIIINDEDEIEKIVILYRSGKFKQYSPL